MKYRPQKIELKWQKFWQENALYETPDSADGKKNFMLLTEFPYPSGNLHIGHWYAFAVPDISARFLRMKGYNVMYPIGFDAFGLPAENAAIQRNINPKDWTKKNISYMTRQLKSMGAVFDWARAVSTIEPEYYKWTQWMFLKMYERGLVYRAKTLVNWCPKDKTVLANEQVQDGRCERCDTAVVKKEIEQWMFRITDYAEKLINDLEGLDWPETTKLAQKNWIGRSEGVLIKFQLAGITGQHDGKHIVEVFTTRPDTLFGATFFVVSPELAKKWLDVGWQAANEVKIYIEKSLRRREFERIEGREKTGVFSGIYATNPANKEKIPVWVADYVLGNVGTGAIMAVPAHDQRDYEFAQKYNLSIKMVVCPHYPQTTCPILDEAYEGTGHLVDSGQFNGMPSEKAKWEIMKFVSGEKKIQYRLHDWVLSRQRYWGVPIPMTVCGQCGYQPISENDLPVKLPPLKDFLPTDEGRSPLAKAKKWIKIKCPKCGDTAERETDTMDTFVDSSWYFIRYADPKNSKKFAAPEKMKQWFPVPLYIGGSEHNTMHLLYSRFFTKALFDLEQVHFSEPFIGRRNHGVILGPDHQKMSKSRGNVIDPDKEVAKYGADTVRMYLAFMGPYEQGGPWNPGGINGIYRFLNRVWIFVNSKSQTINHKQIPNSKSQIKNGLERLLHKTIKKVGEDIENLRYNTAISALMILLNEMDNGKWKVENDDIKIFLRLLSPFAPHLTEELWLKINSEHKSIHTETWPEYDPKLIKEETFELIIQVNGKVRDTAEVSIGISQDEAVKIALARDHIKKYVGDKSPRKIIYVSDRLINFVL